MVAPSNSSPPGPLAPATTKGGKKSSRFVSNENASVQAQSGTVGGNSTRSQLANATNQELLERSQRQRKASSKVLHQVAQDEETHQRRQEEARRKAIRTQRNAPDTEDEQDDTTEMQHGHQAGSDDDEHEEEDTNDMFTSRIVTTKHSRQKDQRANTMEAPALSRSHGRVPISRSVAVSGDDVDEDDNNTGIAQGRRTAPPLPSPSVDLEFDNTAKRIRLPSTESLRETKIPKPTNGQRPKTSDFGDLTKDTKAPFPDHATETQICRSAWDVVCEELECEARLTTKIAKLITSRGSHLRGELKTKARPIVEMFYRFESGNNKKIIKKNREIAENLKDAYGYAYKVPDKDLSKRKGLYKNSLIQKIVNTMWFRNRQDEGVIYEEYFRPIKPETVALVLTAIDCCVDEWLTGIRTDCPFTSASYRDVYVEHLRCINGFMEHTKKHGIFDNIIEKLYNRGRFHAGAQPISRVEIPAISTHAFNAAIKEYQEDDNTETDGESGNWSDNN